MKHTCHMLLFLLLVGHLFVVSSANGDLAPLKVSGGAPTVLFPHQHIRMDSMDVTIRLKKIGYRVDACFHFFNTGETVTEWVGFLKRGNMGNFMRYDAWVEGLKMNVLEEPSWLRRQFLSADGALPKHSLSRATLGRLYRLFFKPSIRDLWLMHKVKFPGNSRTTIRISYEAEYLNYEQDRYAIYEYGTGGYWKDGIGVAAITVDGAETGGVKSFLLSDIPGWRRLITKDSLRLEMTNYEPSPRERVTVRLIR